MATNVTLLALAQMVDLALNCNEGVINFQALHTLLHVMIQQLDLKDVAVEFRGPDSDNIQKLISAVKPGAILYPEYSVVATKGKKMKASVGKKISLQDVIKEHETVDEKKERELRVIERRKDSKEDPDQYPLPLKSPPGSALGITAADLQTVVVIESKATLPQYSVAVSKVVFDELQEDLMNVKIQVKQLTELPSNFGLIEASRNTAGPILDMFNILNLTKRMDANEIAVEKMGSLIEDLAKHGGGPEMSAKIKEVKDVLEPPPDSMRRNSLNQLDVRVTVLEKTVQNLNIQMDNTIQTSSQNVIAAKEEKIEVHPDQQSDVTSISKPRKSGKHGEAVKVFSPQAVFTTVLDNVDLTEMSTNEALALIQEELQNLKTWVSESLQEVDKAAGPAALGEGNVQALDAKIKEYAKQIEELDSVYRNHIALLNEQFTSVQRDMGDIYTKLDLVLPGGDSTGIDAETTLDLANKLAILEREIVSIAEQAQILREEKEEQDKRTETILEQIDVLKIVKANREDLEDALGDKADACMINRKVSHDQFDAACDDLSRGIEEALIKLEDQEEMWRQALDAIHREIGSKLDKNEVDPIREFVNSKLKTLQEKFKSLAALKREHEAAGTRTRFLKNVNCISCDKDVVMRRDMDPSLQPQPYAMPPSRNMAPYLAYELDQLRKQQKCVPGSKNLNYIENALKTRGNKETDHICNRYCGGSHTVTTPQQRVTRLGHFLEQWGPEIAPLNDEYIRGKDNQMYKARDEKLYSKRTSSKAGVPKDTILPISPIPESDEPQHDQDRLVNQVIEEAIANDAMDKGDRTKKKYSNIGAVPLDTEGKGVKIAHVTVDETTQSRVSQAEEARQGRESRAEGRASQVEETKQGRASRAEGRASQVEETQQARASQSSARRQSNS